MPCMLIIAGVDLSIDEPREIDLIPDSTWEKGSPRIPSRPSGKLNSDAGAKYFVSDADFDDFDVQKTDAISFLLKNEKRIKALMKIPSVESATLDFGISRRDVAAQFDYFQPELVRIAGKLGLGLELSQYSINDDE